MRTNLAAFFTCAPGEGDYGEGDDDGHGGGDGHSVGYIRKHDINTFVDNQLCNFLATLLKMKTAPHIPGLHVRLIVL